MTRYKDNPWLIGYFVGNEPSWLDQEERLSELILNGGDRPIKTEFQKFLLAGDTPERRREFIYDAFRTYLRAVKEAQLKYAPNHLNLGYRFGSIANMSEELLSICRESFDVLSFNCYHLVPGKEMMDRALAITGLPMIIGSTILGQSTGAWRSRSGRSIRRRNGAWPTAIIPKTAMPIPASSEPPISSGATRTLRDGAMMGRITTADWWMSPTGLMRTR